MTDDDLVTVEWPFSRLHLDEPPRLMVPVAVEIKSPRKIENRYRGRKIRMPERSGTDETDVLQKRDSPSRK